ATIRESISTAKDFIEKNKDLLDKEKISLLLASGNIGLLAAVNETVADSQVLNFVLVMAVIFVLCSVTYRSISAAVILLIPLNLANIFTLSIMHSLGIGLNINTLPVASIGVGVGIDYGIYLLSRIYEEYQKTGSYTWAIPNQAIRTTGKAIFFTATTMIGGVIFWYLLSSLKFQADMGLLLAIVMFINMLGALIFIPILVYIFKPKFLGKSIIILG
ncbi:MAG: MMPL family transporter, partial [Thermodesulfobacteriota bacterium]|nr:MMPL family transporter [Thermodesulfobacteriota bacterium]